MIKRIIGTLFAWATLALIVVVALHRGRYTSLVELRTEEPAAAEQPSAPCCPPADPDSEALPVSGAQPAEKPDSAGKTARAADSLSASSAPLVDSVSENRPAAGPDSAGLAVPSAREL